MFEHQDLDGFLLDVLLDLVGAAAQRLPWSGESQLSDRGLILFHKLFLLDILKLQQVSRVASFQTINEYGQPTSWFCL